MPDIKLLDCTLRDGGYINDWEFGYNNLISVLERMVSAHVDIIEVGFLDDRRNFDINRSIMPDTDSVEKIYGKIDKKDSMVVGMIDFGTCSIGHLCKCEESYLDGIRVIFKKNAMEEALAFCAEVKSLGYKVFVQAVSITSYSDKELLILIDKVNEIMPYAVSMVDTYGLLHQDYLLHYLEILEKNVDVSIGIGYHSHNNFQLGYANCIEMLQKRTNHLIVVDATLYGMGKSAGNTPIELLAMHLNERYDKKYDINQMLEAMDANIMQIYKKHQWGYSLFYYLSASNNCHPEYVKALMDRHTLSMKSINEILGKIETKKKLLFDKEYINELYMEYQNKECDDKGELIRLKEYFIGRGILLLGPGKNVQLQKNRIDKFIKDKQPIIISTNFIPENYNVDYVFVSNVKRYTEMANTLLESKNQEVKVIATSNVTRTDGRFDYTLNNSKLLDYEAEVIDNSFVMLLKVIMQLGIRKVNCAGFDGYMENESNYFNPDMEYWFVRRKADEFNVYVKKCLAEMRNELEVNFITDSYYTE